MDKEKLIAGVVGGIVAGFSIGVGFMIAQKTMGRFFNKQQPKNENADVADAVAKGVTEGVKQAKVEEDAANFSAMNAAAQKNPRSAGGQAIRQFAKENGGRRSSFMGFDGNPNKMGFNGDPLMFQNTPNQELNSF
jgi:hypothetical protein